jgi:hypothetical protein
MTSAVVSAKLDDLKAKWANLRDVDRALAVRALHGSGVSFRELAQELACSAALLRSLDTAARASKEDLDLARKEEISIRELVRRAKAAEAFVKNKEREAQALKQDKLARIEGERMWAWLEAEGFTGSQAESILDEARSILAGAEYSGVLQKLPSPPEGMPTEEIMRRMKPSKAINADVGSLGWYAEWLARWVAFVIPDSDVRMRAFDLALGL